MAQGKVEICVVNSEVAIKRQIFNLCRPDESSMSKWLGRNSGNDEETGIT